jgi:hypothetical protein
MAVSRQHNVVVDVIFVEVLEGAIAVGLVAIPCIVVKRVWIL